MQWVSFNLKWSILVQNAERPYSKYAKSELWDRRRYQQELRISTGASSGYPHVSESNSLLLHRARLKSEILTYVTNMTHLSYLSNMTL